MTKISLLTFTQKKKNDSLKKKASQMFFSGVADLIGCRLIIEFITDPYTGKRKLSVRRLKGIKGTLRDFQFREMP